VLLSLLGLAGYCWAIWDDLKWELEDILHRERPFTYTGQFHDAILPADRIVVRDGGFNCCSSVKGQPILLTVTNPVEIKEIFDHIQFVPMTNEILSGCLCCGYPGVDWYRGRKRLALTSIQHGMAIRWKHFATDYIGPFPTYGDAPLTLESAIWINGWMTERLPADKAAEANDTLIRLKQFANHGLESTGAPPAADAPETHP